MKRRYGIGILVCVAFVCSLYNNSYQQMEEQIRQEQEVQTAPAAAGREEGLYLYVLKEKDGYVCVYKKDAVTLYEATGIQLEELPEELRDEIRAGKRLQGKRELYDFLENYGS